MRVPRWLRSSLVPLLGLGLVAAFVWQYRSAKVSAAGGRPASARPAAAGPERVRAEGRLAAYPDAEVSVSTETGGTIRRLLVREKHAVRKGQLLAELATEVQRAALAEARARAAAVEVQLKYLQIDLSRAERLRTAGALSPSELDRARHALESAQAERTVADASLRRLGAELARARILAPIAGVVTARYAQAGETLPPGARLVTIADLERTRVEVEVDEYDAARLRLGAPVRVSAEGFGARSWRGRLEEIPDGVTGRRLRPQDPARPTDMRVLLVKVALLEPTPLKLGQRVEVEIWP